MPRKFKEFRKSVRYFLHFLFWNDMILAAHPSNLRKGQGFDGKPHCMIQAMKTMGFAFGLPGMFGGFQNEQFNRFVEKKGPNEDNTQPEDEGNRMRKLNF